MNFKDVKERHAYYVDFNPVKGGEFPGNHLAIVLKRNIDKRSVIVIPLTSKEYGVGQNKTLIEIPTLPERLKGNDSYAVHDNIRTVDVERVQNIYANNKKEISTVKIEDDIYMNLIKLCGQELEKKITLDEKIYLNRTKLQELHKEKLVDLAYRIINKADSEELRTEIKGILYNSMEYTFTDKEKEDGIEDLIKNILKNKYIEIVPA